MILVSHFSLKPNRPDKCVGKRSTKRPQKPLKKTSITKYTKKRLYHPVLLRVVPFFPINNFK